MNLLKRIGEVELEVHVLFSQFKIVFSCLQNNIGKIMNWTNSLKISTNSIALKISTNSHQMLVDKS